MFAVVFALSVYVAHQDERAVQHAAEIHKFSITPKPDEQHPQENLPYPADDGLRWYLRYFYSLFRWPNGTETWALILTLMAIAEQTKHTARSADVANKTLISTLRPKLIVRKITICEGTQIPVMGTPDANPWEVEFDIANIGTGTAKVLDYKFFIKRFEPDVQPDRIEYVGGSAPFTLEPGEDCRKSIPMPSDLINILRMLGRDGLSKGYQQTDRIYFYGIAQYADTSGTKRNMAVCRHYMNSILSFKAVDDPDREYSE
ncbi:MAG: hypothetical protein ACLQM6_12305 [Acidobacteriaceae bacterium]